VDLGAEPVQEPPPLDADNFPSLGGVPGSSQPAPPAVAVPPSQATDAGTTPSGSRMHSQAMSMPHQAPPPQPFHPHHPQMRNGVLPTHMGQQMMHHQQMLPHPHHMRMQACAALPCDGARLSAARRSVTALSLLLGSYRRANTYKGIKGG
jgi:hypothetical protein